jgi:hypothetical protein
VDEDESAVFESLEDELELELELELLLLLEEEESELELELSILSQGLHTIFLAILPCPISLSSSLSLPPSCIVGSAVVVGTAAEGLGVGTAYTIPSPVQLVNFLQTVVNLS